MGLSLTFVERDGETIIQTFTCAHGDVSSGSNSLYKEIKLDPQTYVSQVTMVQSEELTICELRFDMTGLDYG